MHSKIIFQTGLSPISKYFFHVAPWWLKKCIFYVVAQPYGFRTLILVKFEDVKHFLVLTLHKSLGFHQVLEKSPGFHQVYFSPGFKKFTRFSPGFGKNHRVFTKFIFFTRFSKKTLGFHQVLEKSPGFHPVLKNTMFSPSFFVHQVLDLLVFTSRFSPSFGKISRCSPGLFFPLGFEKLIRFSPGVKKSPGFHLGLEKQRQVFTKFSPCFEESSNTLSFGSLGVARAETKRCLLMESHQKNQTCVFTLPSKVQNTYCITSLATVGQNTCWAL